MKWIELTKNKAHKEYLQNFEKKMCVFNDTEMNDKYKELREDIWRIADGVLHKLNISKEEIGKAAYTFDYLFAVELYCLLNEKYRFNKYLANNDKVWIYIHICVLPDLLFYRWGNSPDHIYKRSARLWFKSLWWYVYIAWQDTKEATIRILEKSNSDTIVQLVERTGPNGYRIELYKEILYRRSLYNTTVGTEVFRKIMSMNTARMRVIDPYLFEGGIQEYVKSLYKDALMEGEIVE